MGRADYAMKQAMENVALGLCAAENGSPDAAIDANPTGGLFDFDIEDAQQTNAHADDARPHDGAVFREHAHEHANGKHEKQQYAGEKQHCQHLLPRGQAFFEDSFFHTGTSFRSFIKTLSFTPFYAECFRERIQPAFRLYPDYTSQIAKKYNGPHVKTTSKK